MKFQAIFKGSLRRNTFWQSCYTNYNMYQQRGQPMSSMQTSSANNKE